MKSLSLRIICVFIIAMFCLAPLNAIDLNLENNNNKSANQSMEKMDIDIDNSNSIVDDKIKTENDSAKTGKKDSDFKKVNSTKNISEDNEHKTLDNESTNLKEEKELLDLDLRIQVEDICQGEKPVAVISTKSSFNDYVELKLDNYDQIYYVKIVGGSGKATINENLLPGEYSATVRYDGGDTFKADQKTAKFTVKQDPELNIVVDDISQGQKPVAKITANTNINRFMEVTINGFDNVHPVKVVNGYGETTIDEELEPGKYVATVSYTGDNTYKSDQKSTQFIVRNDEDPNLNVKVDTICRGEEPTVEITADRRINGYVELNINNSKTIYPIKLVNGSAKTTIHENLAPGKYSASVSFDGNNIFRPDKKTTEFTVKAELNPKLNIKIKDIHQDENPVVEITADSNLNSTVKVKVNDSNEVYTVNVVKGAGNITLMKNLIAGKYSAIAIYDGSDIYKADQKTTEFTVKKYNPQLGIHVNNTCIGQRPVAEITANSNLSGYVEINIDDSNNTFTARINNGYGKISIDEKLDKGNHSATVVFNGDKDFEASKNTTTFNIIDVKPYHLRIEADGWRNSKPWIVEDAWVTSNPVKLKIYSDPDFTGKVDVTIDCSNYTYVVNVVDGYGELNLGKLPKYQTYYVTATYDRMGQEKILKNDTFIYVQLDK